MHEYKAKVVKIIDGDTIDVDIDVDVDDSFVALEDSRCWQ